ncbi:MAG: hypothetical protein R2932_54245 [Caldilineaceae bacterium]
MIRTFLLVCFVLLASGVALIDTKALQAGAIRAVQTDFNHQQTAPLPPSPTAVADETVLARLDRPFTVGLHQWVTVDKTAEHFSLQLSALVQDSRCPAGVNCIVAGQVEFRLLLRTDNVVSPQVFQIGSYPINDQNKVRYAGYEIELTAVQPLAPPPGQRLNPSDYRAMLIVRRDGTVAPKPTIEPTWTPTVTPTAIAVPQDGQNMDLGQPFTLHVGESVNIPAADLQLTLRSMSDDSGCLTATDCSVMMANGTLALQRGDERELLTFITSFSPEQAFTYDFAGYVVELLHLEKELGEKGQGGSHVATFVVQRSMPVVALPTPERVADCPGFSRFDAAALLQEEVEPRAVANLVFGPLVADVEHVEGFCGYIASVKSGDIKSDLAAPYIASALAAERGVVAATINRADSNQLLQLVQLVTAGTAHQPTAIYQLQAELAAGFYEDVISTLTDIAAQMPTISVTPVDGVGAEGVWLWQPLPDGFFGMLIAHDGDRFPVVVALLNADANEEVVLAHAMVVARYLQ